MSKSRSNLPVLIFIVLFLSGCYGHKALLTGVINDKAGNSPGNLEISIITDKGKKTGKQVKQTSVQSDGTFQVKARQNRPYILEVSGKQGSGRVFIPAGKSGERIDISYPVTEKIVILHTNDRHFDLNRQDEYSRKIEEVRAVNNDVFLFEAGDVFVRHGKKWTINDTITKDTIWYGVRAMEMIDRMNEMGYDIMTFGNHDLAYINDYTGAALRKAKFPILAANMEISTNKLPKPLPYTVLNTTTGRKIAVLGLSTDNTGREGVIQLDLNQTVDKYLHLKESSDVFLALSHLGLKNDIQLANDYPAFDAIIGGHSHNLLNDAILENSVLIAQAGGHPHEVADKNPDFLGEVEIILENGKIVEKRGHVMPVVRVPDSEIEMPERGLCAHRGAMATHPENTIPAFREAVKAGAHMIEFDVQLTKDKQLVIMHDNTVDRTTNGKGKVSDFTFDEIRKLDAGSWKSPEFKNVKVPHFREVLAEMSLNVWLNVHIKDSGETPVMIAEILKEEGRLHQAFLACGTEAAEAARKAVPEIKICNMDRQGSGSDYVNRTIEMDAGFIQLAGKIVPDFAGFAKKLKANGIHINYFGTDSPDEIRELFNYGVEFPLVNDIRAGMPVAKEFGIKPVVSFFK